MQKTTDKRIHGELMKLHSSSMKDILKDLSPDERKAAKEAIKDLITEWAISTGRAEVFKSAEYPEFIGRKGIAEEKRLHEKLIKPLEGAEKELKSIFGDNLIALSFGGSHATGHAGKESDVDLYLLLREKDTKGVDEAFKILGAWKGRKFRIRAMPFTLEETKSCIRKVDSNYEKTGDDVGALVRVFVFFSGKRFGDDSKIHAARKEIVEELAKSPFGKLIWDEATLMHIYGVVALARISSTLGEVIDKLGVSVEDYKEIVKARERFALPSFKEIKKQYGVAKEGIETKAGVVRVVDEPFGPFGKFTDFSATYHVILKPSASSKEKEIGRIEVDFGKVEDLEGGSFHGLYEAFRKKGLHDTDTIAEISAYAPLGKFSLEEVLSSKKTEDLPGHGIGPAATRLVLEDLKSRGVGGVWVNTAELPAIKVLMQKLEFENVDALYFFKKL